MNILVGQVLQCLLHFLLLKVTSLDVDAAMLVKVEAIEWQHLQSILWV